MVAIQRVDHRTDGANAMTLAVREVTRPDDPMTAPAVVLVHGAHLRCRVVRSASQ